MTRVIYIPGFNDKTSNLKRLQRFSKNCDIESLKLPGHDGYKEDIGFSMFAVIQELNSILEESEGNIILVSYSLFALPVIESIKKNSWKVSKLLLLNPAFDPNIAVENMFNSFCLKEWEGQKSIKDIIEGKGEMLERLMENGKIVWDRRQFISDLESYNNKGFQENLTGSLRGIKTPVQILYNPNDQIIFPKAPYKDKLDWPTNVIINDNLKGAEILWRKNPSKSMKAMLSHIPYFQRSNTDISDFLLVNT